MDSEKRRAQKRAATKRWMERNPELVRELRRAYYLKNKESKNAYSRQYRLAHPEETRERMRKYHKEHREELLAKARAKRLTDPSVREREKLRDVRDRDKRNKQHRESAKRNHAKILASVRKYNATHPKIRKAIEKRYKDTHPEVVNVKRNNRRARVLSAEGSFTQADILAIWGLSGNSDERSAGFTPAWRYC